MEESSPLFPRRSVLLGLAGLASLLPSITAAATAAQSVVMPAKRGAGLRLNVDGYQHAVQLIAQGRIALDKRGDWATHRPSADAQDAFIDAHGFGVYATWFLAVNDAVAEEARRHFAYPFGDFECVRRSALIAAQFRAREWGHAEVDAAAARLVALMEAKAAGQTGVSP